jgi:putative FmdB family regulatory protein
VPVYEYHCSACGHEIDILHGISESGPRFCPACGAEGTMRKAFAPPAIVFKGSGWAKKDRSASSAPKKSSSDGDSTAGASTDSKSTEATPPPDKSKPAAPGGD